MQNDAPPPTSEPAATTPGAPAKPEVPPPPLRTHSVADLLIRLDTAMLRDRPKLRARLRNIDRLQGPPLQRALSEIAADIDRSATRRSWREENRPRPTYPLNLPVVERREEVAKAIAENQVVILCGETGSGKTTQLPKICLELGRGVAGLIGHTQPRRIAARAVASRIAQELNTSVGRGVGYKVRFNDQVSDDTYVKLMTDGILLAETQGDRFLNQYDTLIIDEAHERSLNIDFLLGYLKQLLPKRPDLKLIVTSATIDPQRFSRHFDNAPMLTISGRTYPVETLYRPLTSDDPEEEDLNQIEGILRAVKELPQLGTRNSELGTSSGDILVFLSGEREIRETAEALQEAKLPATEVIPLYARLSNEEQMRVFQPHRGRRIVLATNVAETSLTVPGIRYVIDPGYARISRYAPRTKVQRLPVERISQASADQRKGRCGRVAEGVCIRLYAEQDFAARPQYTDPEILRTNLASVILQMKSLRLGDIMDFPFIEPPDYRMIRDGYATLHELGAIDEANELTDIGWALARIPIDPKLGRMILAARDEQCLEEVLVIAAALSVQDPRERPLDKQEAADESHKKFQDENSDFITYLNLWRWFHNYAKQINQNQLRKLCKQHFLSYVRLREWHDIHNQLFQLTKDSVMDERRQRRAPRRERPRQKHVAAPPAAYRHPERSEGSRPS